MGFISDFKTLMSEVSDATGLSNLKKGIGEEITRRMNTQAPIAAGALMAWVSAADGEIQESEIEIFDEFSAQDDLLSIFDHKVLQANFEEHATAFMKKSPFAVGNVRKALAKETDPVIQQGLISGAMALAESSDGIDDNENKVLCQACAIWGLEPAMFGLTPAS